MGVLDKDSKLLSICRCKCPRCHEGDMFLKNHLWKPTGFHKMNKTCAYCGQSFEPEPGFYFGAMFVSYGINTAIFIALWVLLEVTVEEISLTAILSLMVATILLFLPLTFRLSRSIWITLFVPYRPESKTPA